MSRQRWALGISYNGQAYDGWQSQPSGQTVGDQLETALAQFMDHPGTRFHSVCGPHGCGRPRPDAGGAPGHNAATASPFRGYAAPTATCHLTLRCNGRNLSPTNFIPAQAPLPVATPYHVLADISGAPRCEAGRVGWVFRPLDGDVMRAAAAAAGRA